METDTTERDASGHDRRSSRGLWVAGAVIVLLVAYLLSPPLVLILCAKTGTDWGFVSGTLYLPLVYLGAAIPPVDKFYEWYIDAFFRWTNVVI